MTGNSNSSEIENPLRDVNIGMLDKRVLENEFSSEGGAARARF